MLQALQGIEFRLEMLHSRAIPPRLRTSMELYQEEIVRKHGIYNKWIEKFCAEINKFYANQIDDFPNISKCTDLDDDMKGSVIIGAWVKSTKERMDLFYDSASNREPFPSLLPPSLVAKDVSETAPKVRSYYKDGMPWPGYWAFEIDQIEVFGPPKNCEMDFRIRDDYDRRYVEFYYLKDVVSTFQTLQSNIRLRRDYLVETSVIDLFLNRMDSNNMLSITYIQVRPCIQRKGLLTIYLYVIIEACIASGQLGLYVKRALPFTQELFSRYGFKKVEEIQSEEFGLVDMQLNNRKAMTDALGKLQNTGAVKKLRTFRSLDDQIISNWKPKDGSGSISEQEEEIQRLLNIKALYFGDEKFTDPDHVYYLDPKDFPTADELADPEYVQAQFPKQDTKPQRYADGQSPGS